MVSVSMSVFEKRERRNVNLSHTVIIYIPVRWKWSTAIETIPSHFHPLFFHLSKRSTNTQHTVHGKQHTTKNKQCNTEQNTQHTKHTIHTTHLTLDTPNTKNTHNTQNMTHSTKQHTTHSTLPINSTKQQTYPNSEIESHNKKLIRPEDNFCSTKISKSFSHEEK